MVLVSIQLHTLALLPARVHGAGAEQGRVDREERHSCRGSSVTTSGSSPRTRRLSRASALVGGVAGAIGALLLNLTSTETVLIVAAAVHLAAMPLALRIPKVHVAARNPIVDDVELRGSAVTFAANATSAMRAGVGFLAFFIAFNLKVSAEPAWFFGLVIAAGGAGGFIGSYIAPFARQHVNEEMLLALVPRRRRCGRAHRSRAIRGAGGLLRRVHDRRRRERGTAGLRQPDPTPGPRRGERARCSRASRPDSRSRGSSEQ